MSKKFVDLGLALILSFSLYSCVPMVVGTAAKVTTLATQDRSAGDALDDTTIWSSIKKEFISQGIHELFTKIKVEVIEGRVLLTGKVDSSEAIRKAVEISWSRSGVKEVLNELKIAEHPTNKIDFEQYTVDSWITGRIRSQILLDKEIKSVNYSIITDDNIVYLFGIARSEEEMEKVCDIASRIRGVDKVISYVRVKDSEARMDSLKTYKD